jgi:endonuclease/exonuclease/phosphatase family metal-dependent hydrolase
VDFAQAVYAKDKAQREEFIFVSAHIQGCDLDIPQKPEDKEGYLANVKNTLDEISFEQIKELQNDVKKLKKNYPKAKIIIQGDFNNYPEYFDKDIIKNTTIKDMNFFEYLKKNDLVLVRTNEPTEFKGDSADLQKRELDYAFVSPDLRGRVEVIESDDQELSLVRKYSDKDGKMHFDPMLLFSDHRPIWMKISPEKKPDS